MPSVARGLHHLIRPDDVVRHEFREEVVAVVGRDAAREAGIVRRRGEVDDGARAGRGPAERIDVRERRHDGPLGRKPGRGAHVEAGHGVPAGDELRDRRPPDAPGRAGDENAVAMSWRRCTIGARFTNEVHP